MHILLKNVKIVAPTSPLHGQQQDILVENGVIRQVAPAISAAGAREISGNNLHVSPGWMDVFAHFCDPGQEYKEDLQSGADAAARGGFTTVMIVPNTQPALHTKPQITYVLSQTAHHAVQVLPIGAVTKNLEGSSLSEMYEMQEAGAVAFSDGFKPVQSPGLLLKALQYVKAFDGTIIQLPDDLSISAHGLMHEGIFSTQLGMPGKPALAEELIIQRDLELAQYTGSRIHFTGISTARSVELIARAKAAGIQVTCSVTPYHLSFTDADLVKYNTFLKVNPPLRTAEDVAALREAVLNGTIDCFATHHQPQDWDAKQTEFEYAKYGMTGLETCFGAIRRHVPQLPLEQLIRMLTVQPRQVFHLPAPILQEGAVANLTIFDPDTEWTFTVADIASRSKNSAYIDTSLKGKVKGIISKNQVLFS
ncbi:dihydroorotase [Chitinophaga japonensis]|uniref:Dihydroorotase n=1 Tax=Chitinophaga japonensis TaxID=104662 RepID=A0A562T6W4_CHIJA|nr:dihydroorotase [Chitinophaga japonensis]TWI89232.1 dihydroorotase [Chitinophaga japonensis]